MSQDIGDSRACDWVRLSLFSGGPLGCSGGLVVAVLAEDALRKLVQRQHHAHRWNGGSMLGGDLRIRTRHLGIAHSVAPAVALDRKPVRQVDGGLAGLVLLESVLGNQTREIARVDSP
jgi:hypothetical protein